MCESLIREPFPLRIGCIGTGLLIVIDVTQCCTIMLGSLESSLD
jgi:hypothetical protein